MVVSRAALLVVLLAAGCAPPPTPTAVAAPILEQDAATRAANLRQAAALRRQWYASSGLVDPAVAQAAATAPADPPDLAAAKAKRQAGRTLTAKETALLARDDKTRADQEAQAQAVAQEDARIAAAQAQAAYQRAVLEQHAHADCVYQAQMANVTSPGLVNGLLTGIAAGSVCENYYRNIGVVQ